MKRVFPPRAHIAFACAALFCALFLPLRIQAQTTIANSIQTYATITSGTYTLTGRSELRITGAGTPLSGATINLNSSDSWLFFTNIKPSVVNATAYRNQIKINGAVATLNTNCRIVEYGDGTVVIPHSSSFAPMTVYTGPLFSGNSMSLTNYTAYNSSTLGAFNDTISSFKLKRGYMATIAQNSVGTGTSRNYVAADGDIEVALLPTELNDAVSFVRVFPFRWVTKKGSCDVDPVALNATWHYNWDISKNSTLDWEYVAIKQQPNWPSTSQDWKTRGVNHLSGFNEPENPVEDAYKNLTPVGSATDAAARWPELLGTGLRVGAPAVTDGGYAWLATFMDAADAAGYRVDYVPVHYYRGYSNNDNPVGAASAMYDFLKSIHDLTGRPVWVTEFNNGANWTTTPDPNVTQNKNVIEAMINMMDDTPWIERYAVYSRVEWFRQTHYDDGSITPMGTMYRDHKAPMAYQHVMPDVSTPVGALYRFENDTRDSSANGHAAITKGAATFTTGKTGQAIVMSGAAASGDYVWLPPRLGDSTDFTFGAWVYWTGGSNWQRIFDLGAGTSNYMFLTPNSGSGVRFAIRDGGTEQQLSSSTALPVNTWTHVAVTISGNTGKLFVNGTLVATNTSMTINPVDIGTTLNYLGKSQFSTDPYFAGRLDDVQFLPSALADAAVAKMMTNTPPVFASSTISKTDARQGIPYNGTIAGTATDAGDTITYSKYSGPAWLTVAASGALSGTPPATNQGLQEFIIIATDSAGATASAALNITLPAVLGNGTWATTSSGTWSDATKWNSSFPANGAGNTANFTPNITADTTVTLDSSRTIGGLNFGGTSGTGSWTLNSTGGSTLTLQVASGTPSIAVNPSTASKATITASLSGTSGLIKSGTGTLVLAGDNNSLSGAITINNGIINVQDGDALGSCTVIQSDGSNGRNNGIQLQGNITIPSTVSFQTSNDGSGTVPYAIVNVSGNNTINGAINLTSGGGATIIQSDSGALALAGNISPISTTIGARTLILQGASTDANTVSGAIVNNGAAVTNVTKNGTGTWTLSGANTYTGATTLSGGTLAINGSIASGSTLSSAAGTVLTGSGTIGQTTVINGTHSPGAGIGTQTFTGTLRYGSTSRISWELGGNTAAPASFDRIAAGTVTVDSGARVDLVFNGLGSSVNFADPFWKYPQKWTVLTGASINGAFALSNPTASGTFGTFALQPSGTAVAVTFTPSGPVPAPQQPTGLTTTYGVNQVSLAWTAATGADGYTILRATSSGGPYATIASGLTATSYTDTTATNGTTYYYIVTATNSSGTSVASNPANATPHALLPYPADANTLILFHFDEASGSAALNSGTLGGNAYSVNMTSASATPPVVTGVLGATSINSFGKAATFTSGQLIGYDYNKSGVYQGDTGALSADALPMSTLNMGNGGQTPWTIEAMVYCTLPTLNVNQEIVTTDSSAGLRGFQFRLNVTGELELNLISIGTEYSTLVPTTGAHAYAANTWYHVAATYDGTDIKLYWTRADSGATSANLIGSIAADADATFGAFTGPLCIGGENRNVNGEYFRGRIDEVRISKVARVATAMQPAYIDVDADGLPDEWERQYFGSLARGSNDDPDGDESTNAQELAAGANPTDAASNPGLVDVDADGLPDNWEEINLGNLSSYPYQDNDSDGYTNQAEMVARTNPLSAASKPSWKSPRVTLLRDSEVASDALLMGTDNAYGRAINGVSYNQQILLTFNGYQYTAWYNTSGTVQKVWLARRSVNGANVGAWEKFDTGSEFTNGDEGSWDGHNVIAFGICPADGTFHFAWDHHGHPLRYRRSIAGLCTTGTSEWSKGATDPTQVLLPEQNWLVAPGQALSIVTYPMFTATPGGGLVMNRRFGGSGDGDQLFTTYIPISGNTGGNWTSETLFLSRTGNYLGDSSQNNRNAYVNGLDFGPDGKMHVTWTWREGASTSNHDICYAYSADGGVTWRNTEGTQIADTSSGESINLDSLGIIIKPLDVDQLLINQQAQTVDKDGRVHVLMLHRREEADYDYPKVTSAAYSTRATAYHHYFRDPATGKWSQRRLPPDAYPVGSRPRIGFDADGNLYAVYVSYNTTADLTAGRGTGRLVVASASKASQYTDWEVLRVIETDSAGQPLPYLFTGEPLIDHARLLQDRVLSVYIQEHGANSTSATGRPLHVYDFAVGATTAPTLSIENPSVTMQYNTASSPIKLTLSDIDTPPGSLTLSGSAANASLIPTANIVFSGTDASRTVVLTPATGMSGTTSVTITVSDGTATASQSLNVTVLNASQTWRQQNFGADANTEAIAGDAADADGDGVSNLLERAFGGDPKTGERSVLPYTDRTLPPLSIVYRKAKAATDLVFTVEESSDLTPNSWKAATGTSTAVSEDASVQVIRFTAPVGTSTKKFLRVQVTKPQY